MNSVSHTNTGTGEDQNFMEFVQGYTQQKQSDWKDGYYPADVVINAYEQGKKDGQKPLSDLIDSLVTRFTSKAVQAYTYARLLVSHLSHNNFQVEGFFVNIEKKTPNVIVVVNNQTLLNDEFVEIAYSKIAEYVKGYRNQFSEMFDMGLIGSDNLDQDLLYQDGYKYNEQAKKDTSRSPQ